MAEGKSERLADRVEGTFMALADPTRRRVVGLLRERPRRAGEIATRLRVSPAALSRHLKVLRRTELVVDERLDEDARGRQFRLNPSGFAGLRAWLDLVESSWAGQLAGFKRYAESAVKSRPR